jgi:hypothetical protein
MSPRTTSSSPAAAAPPVLHPDVVLVGEEVGQRAEGRRLAEHRPRGDRRLVAGVRPVLDSQPVAVAQIERVGHVPCREHAGRGCLEPLVDQDAVPHLEPRRLGQGRPGSDADAEDDKVGVDALAVCEHDALHAAVALDVTDRPVHPQADPVLGP